MASGSCSRLAASTECLELDARPRQLAWGKEGRTNQEAGSNRCNGDATPTNDGASTRRTVER